MLVIRARQRGLRRTRLQQRQHPQLASLHRTQPTPRRCQLDQQLLAIHTVEITVIDDIGGDASRVE
jgi:hypothetical protein